MAPTCIFNDIDDLIRSVRVGVSAWLQEMQDGTEYARFRMCRHGVHPHTLDASSLAADLHQMLGNRLSEEDRDRQKRYFDSLQEPETGFFQESFCGSELDVSTIPRIIEMSGTYLGFQVGGAYRAIDRRPKYEFRFYRPLLAAKKMKAYLDEQCPWGHSPWGAGGMIDSISTMLRLNIEMGYTEYEEPLKAIFEWLEEHQDPRMGFWGDEAAQGINGLINGGYHILRGTYFWYKRGVAYPERMVDLVLQNVRSHPLFEDGRGHGCHDLDHFFLLEKVFAQTDGYRQAEVQAVAEKRLTQILTAMHREEGGFSFEADNAVKMHNYYIVSPGVPESDMLGTVFYLQVLLSIFRMLGISCDKIWKDSVTHGA